LRISLIEGIARYCVSRLAINVRVERIYWRRNVSIQFNLNDNFVPEQKTSLFHMDVFIEAKAPIDFKQCICVKKIILPPIDLKLLQGTDFLLLLVDGKNATPYLK
jgi:hypothetical protein